MRIKRNNIIGTLVCGLLLTAGLTGCIDQSLTDLRDDSSTTAAAIGSSYIMLSLSQASSNGTRSADNPPKGGELGDGTEKGQTYENSVTSAVVFLYEGDESTNVNTAPANTPVTMLEFNSFTEKQYSLQAYDYIAVSTAQPAGVENGTYRMLAIANPKDLTWARTAPSLTLGDVRDHIEKEAWTEATATGGTKSYTSFLMTSENDVKGSVITLTEENTMDNPAEAFVEVERMAARVDYQASGTFTITNVDGDGNVTGDGDPNYEGATVTITGAAIVNNLTAGSYELKRTNAGYGSTTVTYLGDEEADGNDIATNYVIDPWTDEKTGGDKVTIDGVESDISKLYGVYYPGYATSGDEQNPSYWADLVTAGTAVSDDDGTTWNRIGYTMENTTYATYTDKKYNTGVVFAATFTPATGTVGNSFYTDYNFVYGTSTFFRWNNILYATAEDMMAVAYPSSTTSTTTPAFSADDKFGETTFENISTIENLAAFAATLRNDDPTGYKAYLQTFTELPSDMTSLYWVNYMSTVCGYTFDATNGVTLNNNNTWTTTSTRAVLAAATDGEVSTYEDSQCYYTWWIRHSNNDSDETNGVMEYAIVRNNIYKLQVSSVYSIGGDIPEEGLRIHVYVKDWTMLGTETIDL